jgi:hypothetical protein
MTETHDPGSIREREIRARVEKATAGPWATKDTESALLAHIFAQYQRPESFWAGNTKADGEFIAHAREDIPFLLSEIDRLREAAALSPPPTRAEDTTTLRASAPSDGAERQDLRARNQTAPSVRRFERVGGFQDDTAFIEHSPDGVFTVSRTGLREEASSCYTLRYCLQSVKEGRWYEMAPPSSSSPSSDTKGSHR